MIKPSLLFVRLWFLADLLLALTPQVHFAVSGGASIFGVPRVVVYLLSASTFVSASVVVAYLRDEAQT